MRSVRAALQLIPKTLKDKLKKNERLTGLYVRSVRKSGLFFDAPTAKQTQALYNHWLEVNESTFSKSAATLGEWQAVIFGSDPQGVTKKNIKKRIIANANDAFITLGSELKKLPIILLNIY